MSDDASSSTLEEHALTPGGEPDGADEGWWHVELPNGVCRMTTAAVEEAYRDRVIGARTMVLPPDGTGWAPYGEVVDTFRSEPHAYPALGIPYAVEPPLRSADARYASVPPMATDLAPPRDLPPPRFDGGFGPPSSVDEELRTRRLIFAGVLGCALVGGFFAATGTSGLRALGTRWTRTTGATTQAAPPPAAASLAPLPPASMPIADPSAHLAAPPPTGVASPAPAPKPDGTPKKKRRRHPI